MDGGRTGTTQCSASFHIIIWSHCAGRFPQALANACMDADPARRPTFAELEPMLEALRKEYR